MDTEQLRKLIKIGLFIILSLGTVYLYSSYLIMKNGYEIAQLIYEENRKLEDIRYKRLQNDPHNNQFCGGIAAFQCPEGYICQLDGDYPDAGGKCTKESTICIQVITPARNPQTGEVHDFPTPCDVPEGWIKIGPTL